MPDIIEHPAIVSPGLLPLQARSGLAWVAVLAALWISSCGGLPPSANRQADAGPVARPAEARPVPQAAPPPRESEQPRVGRASQGSIPAPSSAVAVRPANLKDFLAGELPLLDGTDRPFPFNRRYCAATRRAAYMTEQYVVLEIAFTAPNAVGNCNLGYLSGSSLETPTGSHRLLALTGPEGAGEEPYLKSRTQFAIYARNGMQPDDLPNALLNGAGTRSDDALRVADTLTGGPGRAKLLAVFKAQDAHRESIAQQRLSNPEVKRLMDDCNVQAFQEHFSTHDAYLGFLGAMSEGGKASRSSFAPSLAKYYSRAYADARVKQGWAQVQSTDNFSRPQAEALLRAAAAKESAALEQAIASRARKPSAWANRDITCTYSIVWNPNFYKAGDNRMLIPAVARGKTMDFTPLHDFRDAYRESLMALEPQFKQTPLADAALPRVTFNFPGCPSMYFNSRRAIEPVTPELGARLATAARSTPSNELLLSVSFRFTHLQWVMSAYGHGYVVDPDVNLTRVRIHDMNGAVLHTFGPNAKLTCVGI